MKRIPQFNGLYGQTNAQPTAEYLFSELLETRSRSFDWVIEPHTHARLFQLFFLATGRVTFREANGQRDLAPPVGLLILPTALHGFAYSPDAAGRILSLSDALVNSLFANTFSLAPCSAQCTASRRLQNLIRPTAWVSSWRKLTRSCSTVSPKND